MKRKIAVRILDLLVPFGPLLRRVDGQKPFAEWRTAVLYALPHTFFVFWLFSLIPFVGSFLYLLILVPLSALLHIQTKSIAPRDTAGVYLWYFVVITIGFGGLWGFVGHTFLADMVAQDIGWATGSPFQTELAFYHLGLGIAALLAIWLRGHMITALVIAKSIFWYGAAFVHLQDVIVNNNYAPSNVGAPLVGDLILPTVFLILLIVFLRRNSGKPD